MKALIDCDVLRYEIGACGQYKDEDGELIIRDFEFVSNLFDDKIREIQELTWADEEPLLFLTVCPRTHRIMYRAEKDKPQFKPNFREAIATTKPYKGTRKTEKPYHYENLTAYILANYKCVTAEGLEADDLLSVYQSSSSPESTIICSRDKDLRITPGWHYGWECGTQAAYGPTLVDDLGSIQAEYKQDRIAKIRGNGLAFFCAQMLMGDSVDNIPGIPRVGPSKTFELLSELDAYEDMLKAVRDAYRDKYGDEWDVHFLEQAQLLWMVRELDEDGKPVMFEIPEWLYGDVHEVSS